MMSPEELHLLMIRFESRAGSSEGRLTYDTGVMHNVGVRPDDLGAEEYDQETIVGGYVRFECTDEGRMVVSFVDPT